MSFDHQQDDTALLARLAGIVLLAVIAILAGLVSGCSNSSISGNSIPVSVTIQILPLTP